MLQDRLMHSNAVLAILDPNCDTKKYDALHRAHNANSFRFLPCGTLVES